MHTQYAAKIKRKKEKKIGKKSKVCYTRFSFCFNLQFFMQGILKKKTKKKGKKALDNYHKNTKEIKRR